MGRILLHSIRFVLFVFVQVLILNNFELAWGVYPMLYPLFIMLLPLEIGTVPLMLIGFAIGISIDAFSNTFGLHASSAVLFAYFRPLIFKLFAPRDGYESEAEGNMFEMGPRWFIYTFGLLLLIHHTWYFAVEHFKFNEILLVLRKIGLSVVLSFVLSWLVQLIFVSKKKSER